MRFLLGEMPKNYNYNFNKLNKLKEPTKFVFNAIAFISMLLLWAGAFFLWANIDKNIYQYFKSYELLLVIILIVPIHEVLHAFFFPLRNHKNIVFGFWPAMGAFYVTYTEELSRNKWLAVYMAPLVIISIIPLVLVSVYSAPWLVLASIVNAGFAAGDVLAILMIVTQVPKNSYIVQDGWESYWGEL